jgi:hypothetical protein
MTFLPEWTTGNKNLAGSGFVHFWIELGAFRASASSGCVAKGYAP